MDGSKSIKEALDREVLKLIRRHNQVVASSALNRKKYEKRSGRVAGKPNSSDPAQWNAHPLFNPFHVRNRKHSIGHAIVQKVRNQTYKPKPALLLEIPKPSGGTREIAISTIPDAAVSYWLGKRLIDRNAYRFSSYSYAYRSDRNAHHAIQHLMSELRGRHRVFVLEYDFAKYFDSIDHDYLLKILDKHFLVSKRERRLLDVLVKNRRAKSVSDYSNGVFESPCVGIPQGSSVSLFLANVACYELDRQIEKVGVTFARYADDTLIISDSYAKACECADLMLSHGEQSGTKINFNKSPGITMLSGGSQSEIRQKRSVIFLSHKLSGDGVAIAPRAIARMKKRAARIMYNNLLLQPKRHQFNDKRVGPGFRDWDLVTCVNELRRYIYGRITEASLSSGLSGKQRINSTRCSLSFFPLIDEKGGAELKKLDGWLADSLARCYVKRCDILQSLGHTVSPVTIEELISGAWYSFPSVRVETKLPSFFKAWLYVNRAAKIYGLERFPSPSYEYN